MKARMFTLFLNDEPRCANGDRQSFQYLFDANKPFDVCLLRNAQASEAIDATRDGMFGYGIHNDKIVAAIDYLEQNDPEFDTKIGYINGGYDNEIFYNPKDKHDAGPSMTMELVEVY